MKKIHFVLILLLIFSTTIFLAERYWIVPSRFSDFLRMAAEQLETQEQKIDNWIHRNLKEKNLEKFFLTSDFSSDDLEFLISGHPLISSVSFYNKEAVHLYGKVISSFSKIILEKKKLYGKNIFFQNHWYKVFSVSSFDNKKQLGFIVLELSVDAKKNPNLPEENIVFLSDIKKSNLIISQNSFSKNGKYILLKALQESSLADKNYAIKNIDGGLKDIYLYPLQNHGGVIGLAIPAFSAFSYAGFYLILLSLLALLISFRFYPLSNNYQRTGSDKKRQEIEDILDSQHQTIYTLQEGLKKQTDTFKKRKKYSYHDKEINQSSSVADFPDNKEKVNASIDARKFVRSPQKVPNEEMEQGKKIIFLPCDLRNKELLKYENGILGAEKKYSEEEKLVAKEINKEQEKTEVAANSVSSFDSQDEIANPSGDELDVLLTEQPNSNQEEFLTQINSEETKKDDKIISPVRLLEQRLKEEVEQQTIQDSMSTAKNNEHEFKETSELIDNENLEEQQLTEDKTELVLLEEDDIELEEQINSAGDKNLKEIQKNFSNFDNLNQNSHIEKMRSRIFSEETKRVFDEISSTQSIDKSQNIEQIKQALNNFSENPSVHKHGTFFEKMNQAYLNPLIVKKEPDIVPLFNHLQNIFSADGLVYLSYDNLLQCFRSIYEHNIENLNSKLFYFLTEDFILNHNKDNYRYFEITDKIKKDIYFYKKFPFSVLNRLKGICTISLKQFGINGYLLAFYYQEAGALIDSFSNEELNLQLNQMIPAFKLYQLNREEKKNNFDFLQPLQDDFKMLSQRGEDELITLNIDTDMFIDNETWRQIVYKMESLLQEDERIFYITPNRLSLLLRETSQKDVLEELTNWIQEPKIESAEFPADGKNIYSYL